VHCVNTGMKFLIDTGAAISLLPVRNVPIADRSDSTTL